MVQFINNKEENMRTEIENHTQKSLNCKLSSNGLQHIDPPVKIIYRYVVIICGNSDRF